MVYNKRRRSYSAKKRKYKKRRNLKTFLSVSARLNGSKRLHFEDTPTRVQSGEGETVYAVYGSLGCRSQLEALIENTLGQSGAALGLNDVDKTIGQYKYMIYQKGMMHVRNISNHPIFVTIYNIKAKQDHEVDTTYTSCQDLVAKALAKGWEDDMGAGSTSTTLKTGDEIVAYTAGGQNITTYAHHLKIKDSRRFLSNFKIVKSKSFKLNPGDDVYWKMKMRRYCYNPYRFLGDGDETNNIEIIKGVTLMSMIKLTGVIGESAAVAGNCAVMQSEIAVQMMRSASVLPMNTGTHDHAATVNHAIFQADYQGPSEHSHVVDEP